MQILLRAFVQFKIEYSIVFCTNSLRYVEVKSEKLY